jgi:ribosomal protein L7/L12
MNYKISKDHDYVSQRFITIIKEIRSILFVGLKEAKEMAESIRDNGYFVSELTDIQKNDLIYVGFKIIDEEDNSFYLPSAKSRISKKIELRIAAVKDLREVFNNGLYEAKIMMENIDEYGYIDHEVTDEQYDKLIARGFTVIRPAFFPKDLFKIE